MNDQCEICFHPKVTICRCNFCSKEWCRTCDTKIGKCPFCRKLIPGRTAIEERNKFLIYYWVFEGGEFVRQEQPVARAPEQLRFNRENEEEPMNARNLCSFCSALVVCGIIIGFMSFIHHISGTN